MLPRLSIPHIRRNNIRRFLPPNAGEGGLDFGAEAGDLFAVGGHQRLLGFDLGHDGLLCGKGREGIFT